MNWKPVAIEKDCTRNPPKFVSNTKKFVSNTFGIRRQAKKNRKQAKLKISP